MISFFRHTGEAEDGKSVVVNEDTQMAKIQKKIERRRLHRLKQKEKKQEHLKVIQNTLKRRQQRREAKARIVPLSNEHEQFIDKNFVENSKEEPENIKKTNNVTSVEGFTVLGVEHFAKKAKVRAAAKSQIVCENRGMRSIWYFGLDTTMQPLKQSCIVQVSAMGLWDIIILLTQDSDNPYTTKLQ